MNIKKRPAFGDLNSKISRIILVRCCKNFGKIFLTESKTSSQENDKRWH